MKILFISSYYPPYIYGGAEVSTSLLVKELSKFSECTVVTSVLTDKNWSHEGISVIPLLKIVDVGKRTILDSILYGFKIILYPWINAFKLYKFLIMNQFDVIHLVPNSYLQVGLVILIRLLKIPCLIDIRDFTWICFSDFSYESDTGFTNTKHNCFDHYKNSYRVTNPIIKLIFSALALYEISVFKTYMFIIKRTVIPSKYFHLSTISHFTKQRLTAAGFSKNMINVIPNILSPTDEKYLKRKKLFTFAGRLESSKGIWQVIKAFEKANKADYNLCIYGTGKEFGKIAEYIKKSTHKNIILMGRKTPKEVIDGYRSSYAIIAPPIRPEPLGRFVLDSLITRTPLITTNIGGPPEFINDRSNGLLVNPNDIDALSHAITELIQNKQLYLRIVQNLKIIPNKLLTESIVDQRFYLYNKLLKLNL